MARWHKLEKVAPLKTKHGCIDKVIHVWPHRPPPEDLFARELGQRLIFSFKEDLLALMAARSRAARASATDIKEQQEGRCLHAGQVRKKVGRRKKKGDITSPNQ